MVEKRDGFVLFLSQFGNKILFYSNWMCVCVVVVDVVVTKRGLKRLFWEIMFSKGNICWDDYLWRLISSYFVRWINLLW